MENHALPLSLNRHATHLKAMGCYLADLPILDQRVLQQHYGERKAPSAIAIDMTISTNHVERILTRAANFTVSLGTGKQMLRVFPVRTQSPIAFS